jgi:hypothetical protein
LGSVNCTYQLQVRDGRVLSTGRITLEQKPPAGASVRLGSQRAFVRDLQPRAGELHLILELI